LLDCIDKQETTDRVQSVIKDILLTPDLESGDSSRTLSNWRYINGRIHSFIQVIFQGPMTLCKCRIHFTLSFTTLRHILSVD